MQHPRIINLLVVALLALVAQTATAQTGNAPFVLVLGVAQDAGYPQANCYQPHCMRAWENPALKRLTSCIAVIDLKSRVKYLFDATPDIREQLYRLHLVAPDDEYTLGGVFLTHGHIGHYTGLMHFGFEASNSKNIAVYVMPRMHEFIAGNGPWDQLVSYHNIRLVDLKASRPVLLSNGLTVTPLLVPHRDEYTETVGFLIAGPNRSAVFIPDIDKWEQWHTDIRDLIRSVDFALLDGSFFSDGELPGRDMSKIKHPFVTETMTRLSGLSDKDKSKVIFIHFNHSNPLLIDGSKAQQEVLGKGFRVAHQGMRLQL